MDKLYLSPLFEALENPIFKMLHNNSLENLTTNLNFSCANNSSLLFGEFEF